MIEYQTLEQMRDQVGNYIGDTGATVAGKIDASLNDWYAYVARKYRWDHLTLPEEALTASAGSTFLYLPKRVDRVYFLYDSGQKQQAVKHFAENLFKYNSYNPDSSGIITNFSDAGELGRKANFHTSAEMVSVSSSSASDTSQVVTVKGRVNDDELTESISVTGTTPVNSTNSFNDIYSIGCDGSNVGVLTVDGNTSAIEYATLAPRERTARYRVLRLVNPPNVAATLKAYCKKRILEMVNDNDVPEIPVCQALVQLATADHFARQRKWAEAAQFHRSNATEILDTLTVDLDMEEKLNVSVPLRGWNQMTTRSNRIIVVN